MDKIISDLKQIRDKIEKEDDPAAPSDHRDRMGEAHFFIEECIINIEGI